MTSFCCLCDLPYTVDHTGECVNSHSIDRGTRKHLTSCFQTMAANASKSAISASQIEWVGFDAVPTDVKYMWNPFSSKGDQMTETEVELRIKLEAIADWVLRAITALRDCGAALEELKAKDLWRDSHDSWQEYVLARFKITASRAHQLIEFATITNALTKKVSTTVLNSLTERTIRPLTTVPDAEIKGVLDSVVLAADGGKITPKNISSAVKTAASTRTKKRRPSGVPKPIVVRIGGAKITIEPTHSAPVFRGFTESLQSAIDKLQQQRAADAA